MILRWSHNDVIVTAYHIYNLEQKKDHFFQMLFKNFLLDQDKKKYETKLKPLKRTSNRDQSHSSTKLQLTVWREVKHQRPSNVV